MKQALIGLSLVLYISGYVGAAVATDTRLNCSRPGCEVWWQLPAALLWPIWVPGYAVYKIVS